MVLLLLLPPVQDRQGVVTEDEWSPLEGQAAAAAAMYHLGRNVLSGHFRRSRGRCRAADDNLK
jgi:hypothetical protein